MTWNYRIVVHEIDQLGNKLGNPYFRIHEVYYDDFMKPVGFNKNPVILEGKTVSEIEGLLAQMLVDVERPSIRASLLPENMSDTYDMDKKWGAEPTRYDPTDHRCVAWELRWKTGMCPTIHHVDDVIELRRELENVQQRMREMRDAIAYQSFPKRIINILERIARNIFRW